VSLLGSRDRSADPAGAELAAVAARMVGAVAEQSLGPSARAAALAPHGRDGIDERQQLEDVVVIAAAQGKRERCAPSAGDRMVL
jgi:hypothetical protein